MRNILRILSFAAVASLPALTKADVLGGALQGLGQGLQNYAIMEAQRQAAEQAYQQQLQAYQQQLQIERLRYLQTLEERKKLESQAQRPPDHNQGDNSQLTTSQEDTPEEIEAIRKQNKADRDLCASQGKLNGEPLLNCLRGLRKTREAKKG